MPSVFKRKRASGGRMVVAKKYTVQCRDEHGKLCRVTGYSDKAKSFELGRKLESGAAVVGHRKHARTPLTEHLAAYVQHLRDQNDSPTLGTSTAPFPQRRLGISVAAKRRLVGEWFGA